jgi:hypothetical protein
MDALERQPRETDKAWAAFRVYRGLGVGRSLQKAANLFYGRSGASKGQLEVWSSKHAWVQRCRAWDDFLEIERRDAVEEHLATEAAEFRARQLALKEKLLENAEKAAEQASKMLDWPLAEQHVLRESEDGTEVTYVFLPARWSKETARRYQEMAVNAVVGDWTDRQMEEAEGMQEFDFSELSDEELESYIQLSDKLGGRRRGQPPE